MRIPQAVFYSVSYDDDDYYYYVSLHTFFPLCIQSSDESRLGAVVCDSGAQRMIATYSLAAVLVLLAYAFSL